MATRHIRFATVAKIKAHMNGEYYVEIQGITKNEEPIGVVLHGLDDDDMANMAGMYKKVLTERKNDVNERLKELK